MGVPRYPDRIEPQTTVDEYQSIKAAMSSMPEGACRRMVIIDGPNILHSGGTSGKSIMDIKVASHKLTATAILFIAHKLIENGFEVIVLMKKFFDEHKNSDNAFIFEELNKLEVVRFIDDVLDDDICLLRSAEFYGAAVITRDTFKQITYDRFKKGQSRTIKFRFSKTKLTDKEEYHKKENKLDLFTTLKFLRFELAFAKPEDEDFEKVQNVYKQFQRSGNLQHTFQFVDVLADFMHLEMTQSMLCKKLPSLPYFDVRIPCPINFKDFKPYYMRYIKRNIR